MTGSQQLGTVGRFNIKHECSEQTSLIQGALQHKFPEAVCKRILEDVRKHSIANMCELIKKKGNTAFVLEHYEPELSLDRSNLYTQLFASSLLPAYISPFVTTQTDILSGVTSQPAEQINLSYDRLKKGMKKEIEDQEKREREEAITINRASSIPTHITWNSYIDTLKENPDRAAALGFNNKIVKGSEAASSPSLGDVIPESVLKSHLESIRKSIATKENNKKNGALALTQFSADVIRQLEQESMISGRKVYIPPPQAASGIEINPFFDEKRNMPNFAIKGTLPSDNESGPVIQGKTDGLSIVYLVKDTIAFLSRLNYSEKQKQIYKICQLIEQRTRPKNGTEEYDIEIAQAIKEAKLSDWERKIIRQVAWNNPELTYMLYEKYVSKIDTTSQERLIQYFDSLPIYQPLIAEIVLSNETEQAILNWHHKMNNDDLIKQFQKLEKQYEDAKPKNKEKVYKQLEEFYNANHEKYPELHDKQFHFLDKHKTDKVISFLQNSDRVSDWLYAYSRLLQDGKLPEAHALIHELAKRKPDNATLAQYNGQSYAAEGDFTNATIQFRKAGNISAASKAYYHNQIIALREAGNIPAAIDLSKNYMELLKTPGDIYQASHVYVTLCFDQKDYVSGIKKLEELSKHCKSQKKEYEQTMGRLIWAYRKELYQNNNLTYKGLLSEKLTELAQRQLDDLSVIMIMLDSYCSEKTYEETKAFYHRYAQVINAEGNSALLKDYEPILETYIRTALQNFKFEDISALEMILNKNNSLANIKKLFQEINELRYTVLAAMAVEGAAGLVGHYAKGIEHDETRYATMIFCAITEMGAKTTSALTKFELKIKNQRDALIALTKSQELSPEDRTHAEKSLSVIKYNFFRTSDAFYLISSLINTAKQSHAGALQISPQALNAGYIYADLFAGLADGIGVGIDASNFNGTVFGAITPSLGAMRVALELAVVYDNLLEFYGSEDEKKKDRLRNNVWVNYRAPMALRFGNDIVSAINCYGTDAFALTSGTSITWWLSHGLEQYFQPDEKECLQKGGYLSEDENFSLVGLSKGVQKTVTQIQALTSASTFGTVTGLSTSAAASLAPLIPYLTNPYLLTAGAVNVVGNNLYYGQYEYVTRNIYLNSLIAANGYEFKTAVSPENIEKSTLYFHLKEPSKPPEDIESHRPWFPFLRDKNAIDITTFERLQYDCQTADGKIIKNNVLTVDDFLRDNFINPTSSIVLFPGQLAIPIGDDKSIVIDTDLPISINPLDYLLYYVPFAGADENMKKKWKEYDKAKDDAKKLAKKKYQIIVNKLYENIPLDQQEKTELLRMISRKGHAMANLRDFNIAAEKLMVYMKRVNQNNDPNLLKILRSYKTEAMRSETMAFFLRAKKMAAQKKYWEAAQLYSYLEIILQATPETANECRKMKNEALCSHALNQNEVEQAEAYLIEVESFYPKAKEQLDFMILSFTVSIEKLEYYQDLNKIKEFSIELRKAITIEKTLEQILAKMAKDEKPYLRSMLGQLSEKLQKYTKLDDNDNTSILNLMTVFNVVTLPAIFNKFGRKQEKASWSTSRSSRNKSDASIFNQIIPLASRKTTHIMQSPFFRGRVPIIKSRAGISAVSLCIAGTFFYNRYNEYKSDLLVNVKMNINGGKG